MNLEKKHVDAVVLLPNTKKHLRIEKDSYSRGMILKIIYEKITRQMYLKYRRKYAFVCYIGQQRNINTLH